MPIASLHSPDDRGKRWLQAKTQQILADNAVALATPHAEDAPLCYWGTGAQTGTTLYVLLAGDPKPKALPFSRTMIADCGGRVVFHAAQRNHIHSSDAEENGHLVRLARSRGASMAKLTISDAARVTGVARSTLHRAINAGRLSADPDGHLDTAELLRAGYTLQRGTQHWKPEALQDATPRTSDAQHPCLSPEIQSLLAVQQERDLLRMERDLLRRELEAAQAREQAALAREQEAREERRATREREALLLRMMEQMQQRYDRLLDAPRNAPSPAARPTRGLVVRDTSGPLEDPRGDMRRRIVALLQEHPEGLMPAEIRTRLGVDKRLADTCLGMLRYGLLQRVERGRYVAAEPSRHDRT